MESMLHLADFAVDVACLTMVAFCVWSLWKLKGKL